MSHFIQGIEAEGKLVFECSPTKVIKTRMRKYIKSNTVESFFLRKSG